MKKSKLFLPLALVAILSAGCEKTIAKEIEVERQIEHISYEPYLETDLVSDLKKEQAVYHNENGQVVKVNDPDNPENYALKSIQVRNQSILLFCTPKSGMFESKQIELEVTPYSFDKSKLTYTSSNPDVATVSKTGLITAVSEGKADILISNEEGTVTASTHVVVNETCLAARAGTRATQILNEQKTLGASDTVFVGEEYLATTSVVEGATLEMTEFSQQIWASKKDAYFRIVEEEVQQQCEGGSPVPFRVDYIFYTDELNFTYIFKTDGAKRNYMRIINSTAISRYEALCLALESFFVSGSKIITQQFTLVTGESELKNLPDFDLCGRMLNGDDGQLGVSYISEQSGVLGPDTADSFDLPVGTYIQLTDNIRYGWENYYASSKSIKEDITYTLGETDYIQSIDVEYSFKNKDIELEYPDKSTYNQVDSIYDL